MIELRQSTAGQEVPLGYFLDSTNGNDEETALTIANTDIKIWKWGATTLANKNSGGATHISNGIFYTVLDATDSDTLGALVIFVHVAGALAVRVECNVLTANAWDSKYSTDKLEVDVTQIGGDAQSATDLKDFADAGYDPATNKVEGVKLVDTTTTNTDMRGTDGANTVVPDAAGVAPTAAEIKTAMEAEGTSDLDAIADAIANGTYGLSALQVLIAALQTDLDNGTDGLGALKALIDDIQGATFVTGTDSLEAIRDRGDAAWTTGAGGSDRLLMADTTIATLASQISFTLTAGSADDDAYNNCTIVIEDASTATQKAVGIVSNYVGASKTITLKYDPAIFTMAVTDKVYILAENALKSTLANRQLNVAADGDIAGNVDGSVASLVGHTAQTGDNYARIGAAGAGLTAIINEVDANEAKIDTVDTVVDGIQTDLSNATDGLGALKALIDAVDTVVDAIKAKTDLQPSGVPKNVALSNFAFLMVDSTDHITPKTGLTVTAQISKDGAAFGAATNAVSELANGVYLIDYTQAEMNADIITLKFTATGADQRTITIKTST